MVNRPDQDMQGVHTPERKLVLPALPDAGLDRQHYSSPRPGQSIHLPSSAALHGLFTQIIQRLRTDRAFALLSLAISLVVIASFVLVGIGVSAVRGGTSAPTWNSAMTQHPAAPTPAGTIDLHPKFATPSSSKGSSNSSQPSGASTTNLAPTPNETGDQGTLNINITDIPDVATNNSRVQIDVQTSEPGVNLRLEVTYNASPFYLVNDGGSTDDNGNGTLDWNVHVRGSGNGNNIQAIVVVVATDNNGQQATSQAMTVEIV